MCSFGPKVKAPPPAAQFQQVQLPKEQLKSQSRDKLRRRGLMAAIMTGPSGLASPPMTTGGSASVTGA